MNTNSSANNALLHYFDALLPDSDAVGSESHEHLVTATRLDRCVDNGEGIVDIDSNSNALRVVLFKVAGIPLAMSCAGVSAIIDVERGSLEKIMAQDGMVLWQLHHNGQDIHVLDARDMILPKGHPTREINADRSNLRILMLKGSAYGLLCDDVGESVRLDSNNVEWRSKRPTRRWLAGMLKVYNHALLDDVEIVRIIKELSNVMH